MTKREQIIAALRAFMEQRPGMEPGNYGDWRSYRNESASVTRDLHDARELLRAVEWRSSITEDDIRNAVKHAYSGRLSIVDRDDGAVGIDYCTGQYFPTEFRRAVCAVCASALWDFVRDNMPADVEKKGDWLRKSFRREFGARLQRRWFD